MFNKFEYTKIHIIIAQNTPKSMSASPQTQLEELTGERRGGFGEGNGKRGEKWEWGTVRRRGSWGNSALVVGADRRP